jgi:predicted NBD/HSP70 family sugar kinase
MEKEITPLILEVDLGGTKILTAGVDPTGWIVSRDHSVTPAAKGPDAVVKAILDSAERALQQAGIRRPGSLIKFQGGSHA